MNEMEPNNYTQNKKLICDWTENNYRNHYRKVKIYVGQRMKIDKVHDLFSSEQSKWLEKTISFNIQKRIEATNDFEEDVYKLMNNAFYGKTMEIARNRRSIIRIGKNEDKVRLDGNRS